MGVVYKARDVNLDRFVALKFLPSRLGDDGESKARFAQEAKSASALDHPNICTIYEIDESAEGEMYISMAFYEGETLRERLARGKLDTSAAIETVLQVSRGLARAHENNIIHRDIKPDNIMLPDAGEAKIVDFGLAKLSGGSNLTQVGDTVGTAAYMSPEQLQGSPVDQRSDIFSLGVAFYEMLAGDHPFKGEYAQALMYSVLHDEPAAASTFVDDCPPALDDVLRRMLAKNPDERYPDTMDLVADLEALASNPGASGSTAIPGEIGSAAQRTAGKDAAPRGAFASVRKRTVALVAGVFTIFLLLVLAWSGGRQLFQQILGGDATSGVRHVAVLAFSNIGGDSDRQAFCDGLVETLTSKLSQLEQFQGELWVVPSSEIRGGNVTSARQARQLFGANYVITGSVQQFNKVLRLTINLVDARTLRQVASNMIDDAMNSASILQDEVVVRLASMLNVQMRPESRRLLQAGTTAVPGAYELYLRGMGTLQRYDKEENIDAAIDLFEQALKADANYGLAYAGLGEAQLRKFEITKDIRWVTSARQNCEKALEIEQWLPEAQVTLGLLHIKTGQYSAAVDEFQKALELDPHNAAAYRGRGRAFAARGMLDEAEATYRKAIAMKPDYWGGYSDLGIFYYKHGRYKDAADQFRHVVELTPENARGYRDLGSMYYLTDDPDAAIENYNKAIAIKPDYAVFSNLATLYFNQHHYEMAAQMYEKALGQRDSDYRVWGYLASAYKEIPGADEKSLNATKRAVALAGKQLRVNPDDPNVLLDMAGYYAELDRKRSLDFLRRVLSLRSKEVSVYFRTGYTYETLGVRDSALVWIGKALAQGYDLNQVESNRQLSDLRADVRFKRMVEELRRASSGD